LIDNINIDNSVDQTTKAVRGMRGQASNIHLGERNTEEVNNNLDNSIY
jgi:hypothetical protein